MTLFFNISFAWVATISLVLLSIIWALRLINKKYFNNKDKNILKVNKSLRKNHISLGYIFLLTSLIHGILSSFNLLSFNYGSFSLIIAILLTLTYTNRLELGKLWIIKHRKLTIILLLLFIVHLFEVGGFVGINKVFSSIQSDFNLNTEILKEEDKSIKYKDGVYEGIANGYKPDLKVEVTIKNNLIENISIISHNEVGKRFYMPAFESIPYSIIENQSTDVDTISGATYSSTGLINAVKDALSKAITS